MSSLLFFDFRGFFLRQKLACYFSAVVVALTLVMIVKLYGYTDRGAKSIGSNYSWNEEENYSEIFRDLERLVDQGIKNNDYVLTNIIRTKFLNFPKQHKYNLNNPNLVDYSCGQSGAVDKILRQRRGGFFVEAGAFDGESISNTLFFEREREWRGLLVEPDPSVFERLKAKGRKSVLTNACLNIKGQYSSLLFNRGNEMGRIWEDQEDMDWVQQNQMKINVIKVPCFSLYALLLALGVSRVDYLSLDVEGRELSVLKTIPFDKILVDIITVEYLFGNKTQIKSYLENEGFELLVDIVGNQTCVARDLLFRRKEV